MRRTAFALMLFAPFAMLVAACGENGAESAGPTPVPATQPPPAETTTAEENETTSPAAPSQPKACAPETGGEDGVYTNLVAVRIGTHEDYDRIVFEFKPPQPNPGGKGGIPRYEIRPAKPPLYEDPSGRPLAVNGRVFARIVFHGAAGYDFEGQPTYTGPRTIRAGFEVLTEAVQAGDFEATLSWVLGFRQQACWDVREFHDPDRVAIDIPHDVLK